MSFERVRQKRELIDLIREFFTDAGFFELETPLLVPSPGMEAHLHGFRTTYLASDGSSKDYYLPTSPEFAIKKILSRDYQQVFEIARVFRNHGELGPLHHPEFNMLEWYEPGDYTRTMERTEQLLTFIAGTSSGLLQDPGPSWARPFPRYSVQDLFKTHVDIDLARGMEDQDYFRAAAGECLKQEIPSDDTFEDIFFRIWLDRIEGQLGLDQPVIVYDYPASMAALSRLKSADPRWCERWELYINGLEIGNAFSELTDSQEQRRRFDEANAQRSLQDFEIHPVDEELITAVGKLPPTTGIAIGIERLLMALTGETDIRACFLLPMPDEDPPAD